jgi:hypothetical protein
MKLQNIYKRTSLILSYNTHRLHTFDIIINLKGVVAEYIKLKDKLYYLFNNFNSFLRLIFFKKFN